MFQTWDHTWLPLNDRTPDHQGVLGACSLRLFRCSLRVHGPVEKLIFRANNKLEAADVQKVYSMQVAGVVSPV